VNKNAALRQKLYVTMFITTDPPNQSTIVSKDWWDVSRDKYWYKSYGENTMWKIYKESNAIEFIRELGTGLASDVWVQLYDELVEIREIMGYA
jgi:hypothetical protein